MTKFNICKLDKDIIISNYFNNQEKLILNYLIELGHSKDIAMSILEHDNHNDITLLWAEENSKPVGLICYFIENKSKATIFLANAENAEYNKKLYNELERIVKNQGCKYLMQTLSVKDIKGIDFLKNLGYNQEFYHFFKKI
jgi:hypothetical protein